MKVLLIIISVALTGCVAMREKGSVALLNFPTDRPSVYLTAEITSLKNGERRAFMNESIRKDLLKTAVSKAGQSALFGAIHTDPAQTDLHIHCHLTLDIRRDPADFWMSVFTLQLYPDPISYHYTLRTRVTDRRTGQTANFTASDTLTVYNSIWLIPAAPFMPLTARAKEKDQYLFDTTINQIARKGLLKETVSKP
jgi:hypothetical protein